MCTTVAQVPAVEEDGSARSKMNVSVSSDSGILPDFYSHPRALPRAMSMMRWPRDSSSFENLYVACPCLSREGEQKESGLNVKPKCNPQQGSPDSLKPFYSRPRTQQPGPQP